jgi:hypothetical protein
MACSVSSLVHLLGAGGRLGLGEHVGSDVAAALGPFVVLLGQDGNRRAG